jgi:anti-sigma regulatory factor (Ser/Thr protein kinase)
VTDIAARPTSDLHPNFDHRALLHDGPDDLARRVGPVLGEALDRGEPVHLSLTLLEWEALRDQVGARLDNAASMPAHDRYASPGVAMAALHAFVARSVDQGADSVWSVGTVQVEGDPDRDARWMRYESAVDTVLAHTPLRGICAYDTSRTAAVLDAVRSCHAVVDDPDRGPHQCPTYRPYEHRHVTWLHRGSTPDIDTEVIEAGVARRQLSELLDGTMPRARIDDLHLVATELVTNGFRHGRPPLHLRAWNLDDEVVIEVSDHGHGIDDVFADLRPQGGGINGGFGMWLVGQFSDSVSIGREHDRTVVVAAMRRLPG